MVVRRKADRFRQGLWSRPDVQRLVSGVAIRDGDVHPGWLARELD
jgi:hypothetical protein